MKAVKLIFDDGDLPSPSRDFRDGLIAAIFMLQTANNSNGLGFRLVSSDADKLTAVVEAVRMTGFLAYCEAEELEEIIARAAGCHEKED